MSGATCSAEYCLLSLSVLTFLLCIIAAFTGHFSFTTVVPNLVLGMCCTVLTICLGVPSGLFQTVKLLPGSDDRRHLVCAVIRSTGLDTAFFAASSFLAYALLIIGMALLLYLSIVRHSAFSEKGVMQEVRWHLMIENNWILCPICRNKTRIKIRG